MQADLIAAKENLTKILTSKDLKATVRATLFNHQASLFVIVCIIDCSNEFELLPCSCWRWLSGMNSIDLY